MEKMMVSLIWHWLPSLVFLAGCSNWVLGGILLVKTEIGENGKLKMMPSKIKLVITRIVDTRVSLLTCAGLSAFAFVLGLGVMDYYRISKRDTYQSGYQARDAEAYTSLVQRPNVHWRITRSYLEPRFKRTAYDLEMKSGQIVENFIPCEEMGWYKNLVITGASYYNRGACMSFSGPSTYWTLDTKETKGQAQ